MKISKPLHLITLILIIPILQSCSLPKSDPAPSTTVTETPEIDLCATSTTYSSGVTVTGVAQFYRRGLNVTKVLNTVTQMTLGAPGATALPVKFAEVRVLNSSGGVVQCGKTDATGALKALDSTSALTIPNTAGSYTVEVLSRSSHDMAVTGGKPAFKFVVSIKSDIYANSLYKLSSNITSTGSGSINTTLTGYARESESSEVLGGAFNIYNDIYSTYEYLANNTATSNLSCLNPKLDVYWKAGFNPAQYLYPNNDPSTLSTVSYYVRGQNQLFINGGVLGNLSTKDTDHFDDTVILHELGHHIEDVCGKMDSPGGTHYGLFRIDPRLAWSEGWGNFFGTHMTRNNLSTINPDVIANLPASGWLHYLDTSGYSDSGGTAIDLILLNLTRAGSNPESTSSGLYYDKVSSSYPGEGHTREVSISRSLFKGTNTCTSLCSNTNYFSYYWKAFENDLTGVGMGKPNYPFRTSIRFYNRLNAAFSGTMPASIDATLNSDEIQQRDGSSAYISSGSLVWPPYAIKLINNGSTPCTNSLAIQPRANTASVTNLQSDQRYSNHFYLIDLTSLPSVTSIVLNATKTAGTTLDLDLILFKEGFSYNEDCSTYASDGSCQTYAKTTSSNAVLSDRTSAAGTTITKTLSGVNGLSSSIYYLLNVRAFTSTPSSILNTTEYSYTLKDQTGAYLCPSTTY